MDAEVDNYDPHEFRNLERPNSTLKTFVNITKGALGAAILVLPQAIANAGYVTGTVGMILITALVVYCLDLLVKSTYIVCKIRRMPILSYANSMKYGLKEGPGWLKSLAVSFKYLVDVFFVLVLVGVCCVYIIFIAENMKQILDQYVNLDVRIWKCVALIPLLIFSMVPNLKRFIPLTLVGNVLILIAFAFLLYFIFIDLPPLKDRNMVASIKKFPLFLGSTLFAISPVTAVVAIESNMKNPKSFHAVFTVAMMLIGVLYTCFGLFGYWKYGEDAEGSITLNLPEDDWLAHVVRIIYTISILISFPLYTYVLLDLIWNQSLKGKFEESRRQKLYEYSIRFIIIIITGLLAIAIPNLGLLISFIGFFCITFLNFIFPPLLDYCVHWPDKLGRFKWIMIKDILIIIFGFVAFCCGTLLTLKEIMQYYQLQRNFID